MHRIVHTQISEVQRRKLNLAKVNQYWHISSLHAWDKGPFGL